MIRVTTPFAGARSVTSRGSRGAVCLLLCAACAIRTGAFEPGGATRDAGEIVTHMQTAERARRQAFTGYTSTRWYVIDNPRVHVKATMKVALTVDSAGHKEFRILETTGPSAIQKLVFQRMLDTEKRASAQPDGTGITAANYDFRMLESVMENGHRLFVLDAIPKTGNPLLFRGKIWVDGAEYAIVRIEGSPAQNPSFWVRKTDFEHRYEKFGAFWLAASNHSETDVRVFGRTTVQITYGDYHFNDNSPASPTAAAPALQNVAP